MKQCYYFLKTIIILRKQFRRSLKNFDCVGVVSIFYNHSKKIDRWYYYTYYRGNDQFFTNFLFIQLLENVYDQW